MGGQLGDTRMCCVGALHALFVLCAAVHLISLQQRACGALSRHPLSGTSKGANTPNLLCRMCVLPRSMASEEFAEAWRTKAKKKRLEGLGEWWAHTPWQACTHAHPECPLRTSQHLPPHTPPLVVAQQHSSSASLPLQLAGSLPQA